MEVLLGIAFAMLLLIYSLVIQPKICIKKIHQHIKNIDGEVDSIEIISLRESIYCVDYTKDNEVKKAVVRFAFLFEEEWKI
ncbi:MAG: hypothetical protein IIV48_04970 [Clostridium sp.]|jgi:hypothetical protein|nr:hypothetical protein [Clostridium sp.]